MPYVTGQANSLAALITALQNACTANGWTLAGSVLHKGGCYAEVMLATNGETGAPVDGTVRVRAGNGIDGGNQLTDAATGSGSIGPLRAASPDNTYPDWDWPVTYHIHILTSPDEVYLFVNYGSGQFWQNLMFGQSPSPGNAGTGNWFHGTIPRVGRTDLYRRVNTFTISPAGSRIATFTSPSYLSGSPFFWFTLKDNSFTARLSSQMHGAMADSAGGGPIWSDERNPLGIGNEDGRVSSITGARPLLEFQPNTWNDEAALVRCQVLQERPDQKTSIIGELAHLRFVRNDYLVDGAVLPLPPDQWKVYPVYRRNPAVRDGSGLGDDVNIDHSGTMALAIRYDGP